MTTTTAAPAAEVLLVDDNDNDIYLMREAFRRIDVPIHLHTASNGEEALAFLRKEGRHAGAPRPHLILLDLNMPVMDGREMLASLVADPQLRALPVVVMTTSSNTHDILQMYESRCSTYIVKPLEFDDLARAIRLICQYWFTLAALP